MAIAWVRARRGSMVERMSNDAAVIHVFRAGESFAEASMAVERGYPANARAIEPSSIIGVPGDSPFAVLAS